MLKEASHAYMQRDLSECSVCAQHTRRATTADAHKEDASVHSSSGHAVIVCMCLAEDTAPCHLEPSERSCLQWDATAFRDHTSSCKALPVEPFGTVFQVSALPCRTCQHECLAPAGQITIPLARSAYCLLSSLQNLRSVPLLTLQPCAHRLVGSESCSAICVPYVLHLWLLQHQVFIAECPVQINASLPRLGEAPAPPAPVQAPAADLSADEQRYTTLPALEHNTVQLQKGGVLETTTPEEAGSLEAAGAEDASSDEGACGCQPDCLLPSYYQEQWW